MLAFALSVLVWDEHDVARIVSTYKPLRKHPALFDAKAGWNRWIEPRLLDALEELKTGNESAVRSLAARRGGGQRRIGLLLRHLHHRLLRPLHRGAFKAV